MADVDDVDDVLGVGGNRAVDLAKTFDSSALADEDLARVDQAIDEIARARIGLMILVACPTILATGIALLVHRPRQRNWRLARNISRSSFGLALSGRF